jgi:hypothetical protein
MQFKSITAITVLSLVVASLLVVGCITPTDNTTTNQTASAGTATHDALLERYLATSKNVSYGDKNLSVRAWNLTWVNGTSAHLQRTLFDKVTNLTLNYEDTLSVFRTPQNATNYFNAINKTASTVANTVYPSGGAYQKATDHAPQSYKDYIWSEGSQNLSESKIHNISQLDNIVIEGIITRSADLSSYFDKAFEAGNAIIERPFTQSTNERGNDVYKGVGRNASLSEHASMTTVVELAKSKAEAKQLYDQTLAQKVGEGFTVNPNWIAQAKAQLFSYVTDFWTGQNYSTGQQVTVFYYYNSEITSWVLVTETS